MESGKVAVRTQSGKDLGSMTVEELAGKLADEVAGRGQRTLLED